MTILSFFDIFRSAYADPVTPLAPTWTRPLSPNAIYEPSEVVSVYRSMLKHHKNMLETHESLQKPRVRKLQICENKRIFCRVTVLDGFSTDFGNFGTKMKLRISTFTEYILYVVFRFIIAPNLWL